MKNIMMIVAMAMVLQAVPAFAGGHNGKLFEKADTNSDGEISKSEFLANAEERFEKMDANGDGIITKEETHSTRNKMKEKREQWKNKKQDFND